MELSTKSIERNLLTEQFREVQNHIVDPVDILSIVISICSNEKNLLTEQFFEVSEHKASSGLSFDGTINKIHREKST